MSNERKFIHIQNVFDLDMFRMYARRQPEGENSPVLMLQMINGNPRFKVFTNVPTDKNDGKIEFRMDSIVFNLILNGMKDIIDGSTEPCIVSHEDYTYYNQQRSESPVELSRTMIDYDKEEEKYFIAILAKDRPKIKFFFRTPIRHNIYTRDGTKTSSKEDSLKYMKAYHTMMCQLIGPSLSRHSDEALKVQTERKENYKKKMAEKEEQGNRTPNSTGGFNYD